MPELPEVEQFRRLLLPLRSSPSAATATTSAPITVELVKDNPPRKWLTPDDVQGITDGNYYCADVLRKGKLICMVLQRQGADEEDHDGSPPKRSKSKKKQLAPAAAATATDPSSTVKYLYLHMGMTGRISAPGVACKFIEGSKDDDGSVFPPSHTYLLLRSGPYQVAFSDPRKFGSAILADDTSAMDGLAPDALHTLERAQSDPSVVTDLVLPKLQRQAMAIKPLLMDQKRVVAGVGNWVADEVLYQCELHPDQTHLSLEQAQHLCDRLYHILSTAVECLRTDRDFPEEWLFHYRWTNKKAANDHKGRPLAFITSGGRTSAIVASMQKVKKRQASVGKKAATSARSKAPQTGKASNSATPGEDRDVASSSKAGPKKSKAAPKGGAKAPKRAALATAREEGRSVRRKSPRVSKMQ